MYIPMPTGMYFWLKLVWVLHRVKCEQAFDVSIKPIYDYKKQEIACLEMNNVTIIIPISLSNSASVSKMYMSLTQF